MEDSDFTFTKSMAKTNVWFKGIFIGQVDVVLQKNMELEWPLVESVSEVDVEDRWKIHFTAVTTLKPSSGQLAGIKFASREEAAKAMLDTHRERCQKEAISNAA